MVKILFDKVFELITQIKEEGKMKKKKLNLEISEIGQMAENLDFTAGLPGPCGPCGVEGYEANNHGTQANLGMMYLASKSPMSWFSYTWATKCSGIGQTARGVAKGALAAGIATGTSSGGNPVTTGVGTFVGGMTGGITSCIDCHP